MGRDAHRRGTAARESAERRRRAAMTMTSPYLSCHGCGITAGENENGCADIESVLERGWTHARDESYCPICADVRSQTWPDTEETEERAEPMIPKATRRVRETTIRAGVAGHRGRVRTRDHLSHLHPLPCWCRLRCVSSRGVRRRVGHRLRTRDPAPRPRPGARAIDRFCDVNLLTSWQVNTSRCPGDVVGASPYPDSPSR